MKKQGNLESLEELCADLSGSTEVILDRHDPQQAGKKQGNLESLEELCADLSNSTEINLDRHDPHLDVKK